MDRMEPLEMKPQTGEVFESFDVEAVNKKENRALYSSRKRIHPKRASGWFRRFKWWIMAVTLGIYYLSPWLRWDRGPEAPDQAILVDIAGRRFYFFFIEIWPQEFFFVAGMLVMAGIGLFLVTSVFGRAWCGYTCPQTVWVDLFLVVERFFEGDRNARIKLDETAWGAAKITKKLLKHLTWLVIAVATGGAWIFYFADAPRLLQDVVSGQAAPVAYATIAVLTATTYIFGGLMREQVCTYMFPWPRIQAAMLDEHSLTVTYNDWRGEPRSRHAKKLKQQGTAIGDCVDCNACVAVCPMGIDIRDGQQLECITCALCIDACDGVMQKIGLDKGLISYATLNDYDANMRLAQGQDGGIDPSRIRQSHGILSEDVKQTSWRSIIRLRTLIYLAIYAAIGLALLFALTTRDRLDVNILPDRNPVFVTLSDGSIRNGYEVKILNMRGQTRTFLVSVVGLDQAGAKVAGSPFETDGPIEVTVPANQLRAIRLFVRVPPEHLGASQTRFQFQVNQLGGGETFSAPATFEAPKELDK